MFTLSTNGNKLCILHSSDTIPFSCVRLLQKHEKPEFERSWQFQRGGRPLTALFSKQLVCGAAFRVDWTVVS